MSDLSRLRRNLADCERRGKRHARDLAAMKEDYLNLDLPLTREREKAIKDLDALLAFDRRQWRAIHDRLKVEERRLLDDPTATLRFT